MAKKAVKKVSGKATNKTAKASQKSKGMPKKTSVTRGLAIAALVINALFIPGLGTLIGNRTKEGIWQIITFFVGVILSFIIIGIPLIVIAWVWGIISGIRLIQESRQ